jgi:cyclopropane fatty-acyl-phospholipid synthase-like methyltransferase
MSKTSTSLALLLAAVLAACQRAPEKPVFPKPERPVAEIISSRFADEPVRDRAGEARRIFEIADVRRGMKVADIGAGEGYLSVRLAPLVGPDGRVLAEDIVPATRDALARRVERERLDNIAVRLGTPDDPLLPAHSFDRIFMIHMYHEISQPYAFLWNIRPALADGGNVVVVDVDRSTNQHGTPPALLACEFAAVGYRRVAHVELPASQAYLASFAPVGPRPDPAAIVPCRAD